MVTSGRNRSEGWRHAKKDGHANEKLFGKSLIKDQEFISKIGKQLKKSLPKSTPEILVDGAKHVESIFGDKTTSKVDLSLYWNSGESLNISLKKSNSGQVWLVSVERFISAMEFHLSHKLDSETKMGISLFIGGKNLSKYEKYFEQALNIDKLKSPRIANQEIRQSRLVAQSIEMNFPTVWEHTLRFFNKNIALITRLSFAQGLAKFEGDSADVIIYNNSIAGQSFFPILSIIEKSELHTKREAISAGPKNGGSTIQLPTGFLQMHHPQGENLLQFHHQYKKISKL